MTSNDMPGSGSLPRPICELIAENIDSVHTLEILLYLFRHRADRVLVSAVQDAIKSNPAAIRESLVRLVACGFATHFPGAAESFQYLPESERLDRLTGELAAVYAQRQPAVIEMIYRRPG